MQLFLFIYTKSVLFRSFCNGVNEVYRVKHSRDMINCLDNAYDAIESKKGCFPNKEFVPDVFSICFDKDKHNIISLK